MDLEPEELQFLTIPQVLVESISITKRSPKTFYFITLALIFPLSFAILAHSLFTHPIIVKLNSVDSHNSARARHDWTVLLVFQFCYLIFLFAFSLLSTAAVVFTVASIYTAKPVSFSSTISAILVLYFGVHVYITALWHLGSVVSVLEPIYGYAAMRKGYELLKGRTKMAMVLVFVYLLLCALIAGVFGSVVVHGGEKHGIWSRIVVGGLLVGVLVIVNLVGLLVQSVFYYVCKSYHHESIDKTALYDHLGGYLGEYVPLKSSIQLENLNA